MTSHISGGVPVGTLETTARAGFLNRLSWGSVLAGVAVGLTAQLLLTLLGVGIGAATIDPLAGETPGAATLSMSAAAWYVVSGIIASFLAGFVASRVSGRPLVSTGAFHGLVSWAALTLVVFYLITTTIGSLVGGAFAGLTTSLGAVGSTVTQTAAPLIAEASDPFGAIEEQVRQASGGNDPAALRDTAVSAVRAAVTGDEAEAAEAKQRAAQALATAQNITPEQAATQIDGYVAQYQQGVETAKARATEAADAAAQATSAAALVAFIALLFGGIAAWFGGRMGTVARVEASDLGR